MKSRKLIAKIVTGILFGFLILSFAIWGIGDIFRGGQQARVVAQVGDIRIDQQQFSQELGREINRLSQRFGTRLDIDQVRALGIDRQVLQQTISRALFDQQAAALRLLVTDEQVRERIRQEPAFQDELGNFSRARFFDALRATNLGEDAFVASLRGDIKRLQLVNAAIEGVTGPQVLAEWLYAYQQERRVAEYVVIDNDSMAAPSDPTEEDLQAFYEEQPQSFMAPEYRAITLVQLRPDDMVDEIVVTEEELEAEFESRRDDFAVPERRTIEQMVFGAEAEAIAAGERLAAGEDFAAVAEALTGQAPVILESVEEFELLPELGAAAFRLAQDTPSAPLQSPLGWHILRVVAIEPGREPDFQSVRDELKQDIAMRQAVDAMIGMANQFDDELAAGASLTGAAAALGLEPRRIDAIDRDGKAPDGTEIEGLPPLDELIPVVFDTAPGEESLLSETSEGGYFALRVDGVTPAARRPLAEVRDKVRDLWIESEKVRLAREKAAALLERLQGGEELSALAEVEGLTLMTSEPITRSESDPEKTPSAQLSARLFNLQVGEAASVPTATGQVIARLLEVKSVNPLDQREEVESTREGLERAMRNDLLDQYVSALQRNFGVTVNDGIVQETLGAF